MKINNKGLCFEEPVLNYCSQALAELDVIFRRIDETGELNQAKVLWAMQKNKLSDSHFNYITGYGYNDAGRDVLEKIYKDVFEAEAALVRPQIISGTHGLTVALTANLNCGDELLSAVGSPYDTLRSVIGVNPTKGSLIEQGISYKEAPLTPNGRPDHEAISKAVTHKTKIALIQRSKGYCWRPSFSVEEIGSVIKLIKSLNPNVICLVDNCYGEFVEDVEPIEAGADLVVGSLIKNPGGGLAPVGGYIAGKEEFVEMAAIRLSAPGLGREVGPGLGLTSKMAQGLFMAPQVVCGSLKGAVFAAKIFEGLGFPALPSWNEKRTDIVQALEFGSPEILLAFCRAIQKAAPVDSFVTPEPWDMPGYDCPVVMAAGAFVQGSSIELSADAPMKEPYIAYFQGGLTWFHAKLGVMTAVNELYKNKYIKL